ncbi:hypothetical protein LCL61_29645 [Amycolatopsis coloradensis]|uniref:Uncharacterized protein n=1 Tax=Amycolatopsis coloradensis TaxID=76021 RepID=A0ACD5BKF2_9PSEU
MLTVVTLWGDDHGWIGSSAGCTSAEWPTQRDAASEQRPDQRTPVGELADRRGEADAPADLGLFHARQRTTAWSTPSSPCTSSSLFGLSFSYVADLYRITLAAGESTRELTAEEAHTCSESAVAGAGVAKIAVEIAETSLIDEIVQHLSERG